MINLGIIFTVIAAGFGTSKDLVSKKLSFEIHPLVSTLGSFSYALPFYLVALIVSSYLGLENYQLNLSFLIFVLLRSLTDSFAEGFKMLSLDSGDVSVVIPIVSLSPLFLLFISPILTGQPISLVGALGIVITMLGSLIIISRFSFSKLKASLRVAGFSLIAAFMFSLNTCLDWLAVQQATPIVSGLAMSLFSSVVILPVAARVANWKGELVANNKALLMRGFFEACFMISKLAALQFISAHYVSALMQISILGTVLGGGYFLKEQEIFRKLAGSVLIITGIIIIIFEL